MFLSAMSTHSLNTSRDSGSITSLGTLCQYITTLAEKKFFLISSLNLPWQNLKPLALVLSINEQGHCCLEDTTCSMNTKSSVHPRQWRLT